MSADLATVDLPVCSQHVGSVMSTSAQRPLDPVLADEPQGLSREQFLQEEALREVGETILNIEQAVRRAGRARTAIERGTGEPNFLRALDDAIAELEKTRRTLHQQMYFGQRSSDCCDVARPSRPAEGPKRRRDPAGAARVRDSMGQLRGQ